MTVFKWTARASSRSHLLGVKTAVRVGNILNTSSDADAVLVAGGVGNAGISPDAPGTVDAVGAGDQVLAAELEVVLVVDGPTLALGVLRGGLSAGGVADLTLACRVPVSVCFFPCLECVDVTYPCRSGRRRSPGG
jgi:hypothetical protein